MSGQVPSEFLAVKQIALKRGFDLVATGTGGLSRCSDGTACGVKNLQLIDRKTGKAVLKNGDMKNVKLFLGYGVVRNSCGEIRFL